MTTEAFGNPSCRAAFYGGRRIKCCSTGGGGKFDYLQVDGMFYSPEFSTPPDNVSVKGFEEALIEV